MVALIALLAGPAAAEVQAQKVILHLKNGDRVSGNFISESTNAVSISSPAFGTIHVPQAEISRKEGFPVPPPPPVTNAPPVVATTATNPPANIKPVPAAKPKVPAGPINPANPEATPIAATPSLWKHDIRFGLNLRYSSRDSQEFSVVSKSTYGKPPFRNIVDLSYRHGRLDGALVANSLAGANKVEYQLSKRTYIFGLVGGGYDEVRRIDLQYEFGPGFGMELLRKTNFVWKSEVGFNFQKQYRDDDTRNDVYSVRIAEIFAWRIWDKLTADAKIEFFPSVDNFGEYRLRLESTLRYPVSKILSLNLDVIDLYDTQPARNIPRNDLQIRSSIGVTF